VRTVQRERPGVVTTVTSVSGGHSAPTGTPAAAFIEAGRLVLDTVATATRAVRPSARKTQ